jgi:hypothetical protein
MAPRSLLFRNPRAFPTLLLVGGLGLAGYYGYAWYRAPTFSQAEIEASTELNLALDLARMGPQLRPEGEKLQKLRAIVRAEVQGDLEREVRSAQQGFAVGLIAMVFGLGNLVFVALSARLSRSAPK